MEKIFNRMKSSFIPLIIILFFLLTLSNSNGIFLLINGTGYQQILYQYFNYLPDEIYVDDHFQEYNERYIQANLYPHHKVVIYWYNPVLDCSRMFFGLSNILYADLSNFDTSQVTQMDYMFYSCTSLTSIVINSYTQNVIKMNSMFSHCSSLVTVTLNLYLNSVVTMKEMFSNCQSLISINFRFINSHNIKTMERMFYGCSSLILPHLWNINEHTDLNVNDMFLESYRIKPDITVNDGNKIYTYLETINVLVYNHLCSDKPYLVKESFNCSKKCNQTNYNYTFNNICYLECPKKTKFNEATQVCDDLKCEQNSKYYTFEQNNCIDRIEEGYYLNDTYYNTTDACPRSCKTCDFWSVKENKCIKCKENFIPLNNGNSDYTFCYDSTTPDGYFLNSEKIYQPCYHTCKTCNGSEGRMDQKCISCNDGYELINGTNCEKKCTFYYYYEDNEYYCTEDNFCPKEFRYRIKVEYFNSSNYQNLMKDSLYSITRRCYKECPEGFTPLPGEFFLCEPFCEPTKLFRGKCQFL